MDRGKLIRLAKDIGYESFYPWEDVYDVDSSYYLELYSLQQWLINTCYCFVLPRLIDFKDPNKGWGYTVTFLDVWVEDKPVYKRFQEYKSYLMYINALEAGVFFTMEKIQRMRRGDDTLERNRTK